MRRKAACALMMGALLIPGLLAAQPRFGVGGRIDGVSGGLEMRIWLHLKEHSAICLAPHGFGIYTSDEAGESYFYSVGARGSIIFRADTWLSPMLGLGIGHTAEDDGYNGVGGRVYVGLSLAPLAMAAEEPSELLGLRIEFDSGFMYRMDGTVLNRGTYRDTEVHMVMPDIGVGLSYNW